MLHYRESIRSRCVVLFAIIGTAVLVAACGSSGKPTGASSTPAADAGSGSSKLIIYEMGFPCRLNNYAEELCQGLKDAAAKLPAGYKFQMKTATNYTDSTALNNLIQTSLELKPAGLIVFATGSATQTPIMKTACAQGIKIINIDVPVSGLGSCQSGYVTANDYQLGVEDAKWLIAHPPSSKEVGTVNFPTGQFVSSDLRVNGFVKTIEAAGYKVVQQASTDSSQDNVRSLVTNMLTAHPNLGTVFTANSIMGGEARQALKGNTRVTLLTVDGVLTDIPAILSGSLAAEASQDPYREGTDGVNYMVRAIQGQSVPKLTYTPSVVVDKGNAAQFRAKGGLH